MLGAIGATERNLRLVMIAGGLVVGATAALAGAVLGLAAWIAYAPTVQRDTGHAVDAAHLPWWAFAIGIVLAIATSALASRRPAKTMAAVPVVTALSGRPAPPKAVHRSALPGVIVFAAGLACLASAGGLNGVAGGNGPHGGGGGGGNGHALFLLAGLVITITGVCLLAPLAISVLAAGAGSRLPVAIRIALRDLVRYRARSGAALAATTFAVFLAMGICIVASIRFDNPLNWIGPNLSSSQVTVGATQSPTSGQSTPFSAAQLAALTTRVNTLAASLHASAVPLESASTLYQVGLPAHGAQNFTGTVYVATPQLLATYGIKASQIAPGTDILTMRPGLAGLPHMEMLWDAGMVSDASSLPPDPGSAGGPPCTLSNHCVASPAIQTVSSLPSGTSAPNTVITEYAVSKYHMQTQLSGWLIQAPAPLTAAQLSAVRQFGNANEVQVQTATYNPSLVGLHPRGHRAGHRDRAQRAGHVRRPDPQRDRAGPAHAHRHRRQRHDPADDHRGDRRRARPARRDPRHRGRGDRRDGLDAQRPDRNGRRRAAQRHPDPADRAAAGRRDRRLAIRRA